jgi:hypothetical protein
MLRWLIQISFTLFVGSITIGQEQILAPLGGEVKDDYILSGDDAKLSTGFFPITNELANRTLPEKNLSKGWFYRKLFSEHFLQKSNSKFFLAVDPLINIAAGNEQLQNNTELLFQNTRGAQAMGQLGEKFSFYTAFFENQARFVDFRSAYFESRGELRYNGLEYVVSNASIPNGGRTKPFKTSGFDYASSMSYLRFQPLKPLNIHFGNNSSFIGWGHRSLLLSDNSFNFTHLKIDWEIIPGLNYTLIRGKQLNLLRKRYTNLVEPPFERKGIGIHYLSYSPIESLTIGLFESSVYLRDEAESSQSVSPYFYNPVIGINSAALGSENGGVRNFFGANLGWRFHKNHMIYSQFISGDLRSPEYGFQLGYRSNHLFAIKNLQFQVEYNQATDQLYAARNRRMSYTHFNLPLAHTLGNGFEELIIRAGYEWKGITFNVKHIYYTANEMMEFKNALFDSKSDYVQNTPETVNYTSAELGYVMNKATMLTVFANAIYRQSSSELNGNINHGLIFLGIKSNLFNNYMDF